MMKNLRFIKNKRDYKNNHIIFVGSPTNLCSFKFHYWTINFTQLSTRTKLYTILYSKRVEEYVECF